MTEITHQKARTLLEIAAGQTLLASDQAALDAHLAACPECRAYAGRLAGLEDGLRRILHGKWDGFHPALDLQAIRNPSPAKLVWYNLFSRTNALAKVAIVATLLLGYFVIVSLVGIHVPIENTETPTALPTPNSLTLTSDISPTLSAAFADTHPASVACKTVVYTVRENDTLASIAVRFGITKETIIEYNKDAGNLAVNSVYRGMQLSIPLCDTTPSRTASLPGRVLTTTPINATIFPVQTE
jgi:LysM repeat protein